MSSPPHKRKAPLLKTFWRLFCWEQTQFRRSHPTEVCMDWILELLCRRSNFDLVAWRNSKKKASLSCSQHAARGVVVMLHVWYAIAFQFDPHLGDFLFLFFTFFKTFQSLRLGVRFRVSVWVSIRVIFRISIRATVRIKARVRLKVYLLCLLRFCQACCTSILAAK